MNANEVRQAIVNDINSNYEYLSLLSERHRMLVIRAMSKKHTPKYYDDVIDFIPGSKYLTWQKEKMDSCITKKSMHDIFSRIIGFIDDSLLHLAIDQYYKRGGSYEK